MITSSNKATHFVIVSQVVVLEYPWLSLNAFKAFHNLKMKGTNSIQTTYKLFFLRALALFPSQMQQCFLML